MGTKGQGILKISPEIVVKMLNKALADEWLAAMQYWIGAQVAHGPMRTAVVPELLEHMKEELEHADILAKRITQLGGTPDIDPKTILDVSGGGFEKPENPITSAILAQNIRSEQHAVLYYNEILETVRGKDPITHNVIIEILKDEVEHEQDLEDMLYDMNCNKHS
jgi:bacterioferritin